MFILSPTLCRSGPEWVRFTARAAVLSSLLLPGLLQSAPIRLDTLEYHYGVGSGLRSAPDNELTEALKTAQAGDLAGALTQLKTYLRARPRSASALELIGMLTALDGDLEQGISYLQQAVEINPEQATAFTKIGDIHQAAGRQQEAIDAFRQALATKTGDRRAHQRLGLIAEARGDTEAAINHFEKGLVGTASDYLGVKLNLARLYNEQSRFSDTRQLLQEPSLHDNVGALILLATAELKDDSPAQALKTLEHARTIDPDHAGAWLATGIALRTAGRPTESVKALQRSLELNADWPAAQYQLGESYTALDQFQSALEAYRAASADPVTGRAAALKLPALLVQLKRPDEAIAAYAPLWRAGALNTLQVESYGALLETSGKLAEAEALYDEWLERERTPRAIANRARLAAARGRYTEAQQQLKKAVREFPDETALKVLLATVQQRNKDYTGAAATLRKALTEQDEVSTRFQLATVLDDSGRSGAAQREYERVIKQDPQHVGALNNLAVVLMDQRQVQQAVKLAQRAAALAPDNIFVADTLGWALFKAGDVASARRTLEQASKSTTQYAPLFYHLAEVYSDSDPRLALAHVEKALAISTRFDEAEPARALRERLTRIN